MKKLFLLFALSILFSCSKPDSNATNNPATSISSGYHPPTWIQGTWGVLDYTGVPTKFYTFTTDNVCQITTVSKLCWKDAIAQTPTILSGNDTSTATNYTASLISGNGTVTLSFEKVSATKILWNDQNVTLTRIP